MRAPAQLGANAALDPLPRDETEVPEPPWPEVAAAGGETSVMLTAVAPCLSRLKRLRKVQGGRSNDRTLADG